MSEPNPKDSAPALSTGGQVGEAVAYSYEEKRMGRWVPRLTYDKPEGGGLAFRNLTPLYTALPQAGEDVVRALVELEHYLDEETARNFSQMKQCEKVGDTTYEREFRVIRDAYSDATMKVRAVIAALRSTATEQGSGDRSLRELEDLAQALWTKTAPEARTAAAWREYLQWFREGEANPDSCVHYSTIADALGVAKFAIDFLKARSAGPPSSGTEGKLREALEFYADPETYFAIGFFPDNPAGDFMDDFEETEELGFKPGKRARAALSLSPDAGESIAALLEDMREAAAALCEKNYLEHGSELADLIRALPLPTPPEHADAVKTEGG